MRRSLALFLAPLGFVPYALLACGGSTSAHPSTDASTPDAPAVESSVPERDAQPEANSSPDGSLIPPTPDAGCPVAAAGPEAGVAFQCPPVEGQDAGPTCWSGSGFCSITTCGGVVMSECVPLPCGCTHPSCSACAGLASGAIGAQCTDVDGGGIISTAVCL
jgi:hypothetical protein